MGREERSARDVARRLVKCQKFRDTLESKTYSVVPFAACSEGAGEAAVAGARLRFLDGAPVFGCGVALADSDGVSISCGGEDACMRQRNRPTELLFDEALEFWYHQTFVENAPYEKNKESSTQFQCLQLRVDSVKRVAGGDDG